MLHINYINFSTPPSTVGINWPANFIKRHSELYKQKQKPLAIKHKHSHDSAAILD
jgi:hypothetical protein